MSVDTETTPAAAPTASSTTNNITSSDNNHENEHLLEHKWALWYRPPSNQNQIKSWETSQKVRFSTETVENFWRGYRRTLRITRSHPVNCDYSLFRDNITPAWEDPFNENGGRWTYNVERRHSQTMNLSMPEMIEQIWLDVMLCLIGEGFDPYGESIAGGVCGIRAPRHSGNKSDIMGAKIHIWTKDASDTETNMGIGKILKECIHAPDGSLIYANHDREDRGKRSSHSGIKMTL